MTAASGACTAARSCASRPEGIRARGIRATAIRATAIRARGIRPGRRFGRVDHRLARRRFGRADHRLAHRRRTEIDAGLLAALRARIGTVPLIAATATGGAVVTAAELTFIDGFSLRLAPCHGPAIAALSEAIATGRLVTLRRAVRPGHLWALGFTGPEPLSVVAGRAREEPGGGAGPTPAPIPVHVGPVAVA